MYNLFLDHSKQPEDIDLSDLPKNNWVIVTSFDEFKRAIKQNLPEFISFGSGSNHKEKLSQISAHWLVEYVFDNKLKLPKWGVHSQNILEKQYIDSYLKNYVKYNE